MPFNRQSQLSVDKTKICNEKETAMTVNRQTGFTLIEVMIVVAIMGLMIAAIAPNLFGNVDKAQKTRIGSDIRQIESALKFYRLDNYRYPSQSQGLEALVTAPSGASGGQWNGPYLDELPKDPWQEVYQYANPGTHGRAIEVFTLGANKAVGGEGVDKDWGNWNITE
jgi:general secretion pathway protein G